MFAQRLSAAALVARIAVAVVLGIPLLAVVWETLNELIAGHLNGRLLLLGAPAAVLLVVLWRFLAGAVQRWDARLHPVPPTGKQS